MVSFYEMIEDKMLVRVSEDVEVVYEDEIKLDTGTYKITIVDNDTVGRNIAIAEYKQLQS